MTWEWKWPEDADWPAFFHSAERHGAARKPDPVIVHDDEQDNPTHEGRICWRETCGGDTVVIILLRRYGVREPYSYLGVSGDSFSEAAEDLAAMIIYL